MKNQSINLIESLTKSEKLKFKLQRTIIIIIFGTLILMGINALNIVTNISSLNMIHFILMLIVIDLISLIFSLINYKLKVKQLK